MADERLEFQRLVSAPPSEVYRALTRATPLRDWLCDVAIADPRVGGRVYLWWNRGYYTAGEYTGLDPDRWVAFSWRGKGEPDGTQVEVHITPDEGGTRVTLIHSGLGDGNAWSSMREEFTKGWERALENLQSLLETGQDLRYVRRPMLGITVGDFGPDLARSLGVPVIAGIRLAGSVEGMGAAEAGLRADDVIVSVDGMPTGVWPELAAALQGKRAGDIVEVLYYRGPQQHRTSMVLSARPLPAIPPTPAALAASVRELNGRNVHTLESILRDLPEARVSFKPEPGEWSALEVMAHLVASERETQTWLTDMINDDERWSDGFENPTALNARVTAIVSLCPTAEVMLDELRCALAETEGIIEAMPETVVLHKGNYWRIGHTLLLGGSHWDEHLNQIERAVVFSND
jgi:uncharacterized protein YndB with AHSA1/START domain